MTWRPCSASRPIRISPLQRLMGQASNGDVARTSFTVDYNAKSATEEDGAWVIELEGAVVGSIFLGEESQLHR